MKYDSKDEGGLCICGAEGRPDKSRHAEDCPYIKETTTLNQRVALACAVECDRQHVGLREVGQLIEAYHFALNCNGYPDEHRVSQLGFMIEPHKNRSGYRQIPVSFPDGLGNAVSWDAVPDAMDRLFDVDFKDVYVPDETGQWVKSFLEIHPFIDGNGRTAFILWNWLNNTMDNPTPLPDFFG